MHIHFLEPAELELETTVDYYNQQSEGLGFEFAIEVKRTLERIIQFPNAWAPLSKRCRRCRVKRFPYGIIYQIRNDKILIIAVMHLHRHPDSWKTRLL
ncbi:type II toxin-antitoxin system RelE/ParE family toxin [candidate division KSB1 bacterium]|nr:type II toxin-antitoxin system RelE/ParE family toxin [candidate division KSB1 bacterium]